MNCFLYNLKYESKYSIRKYFTLHGTKREFYRNPPISVSWLCYSDNKKQLIDLEKKGDVLKDVFEKRKEKLKYTENRIRKKGGELVRDIRHQKELTEQKFREKKEHIIKDILETKAKVKERIEEVVEVCSELFYKARLLR